MTQEVEDEKNRKAGRALHTNDDHTRKVSNLTHPHGNTIEEEGKDSLHSFAFSGSQFRAPSDAENNAGTANN